MTGCEWPILLRCAFMFNRRIDTYLHMCLKVASEIARVNLFPTIPVRLALALNLSDFYNRIVDSHERYVIK